jgi:hypothetical protein
VERENAQPPRVRAPPPLLLRVAFLARQPLRGQLALRVQASTEPQHHASQPGFQAANRTGLRRQEALARALAEVAVI